MSERKRATGFVLMDAAFAADAKFLRLYRRADTPHDFAAAVGVFWLLLGDARRGKSPVIDWDDYEDYAPEVVSLKAVHLLKEDGFDPEVFDRWSPAYRSVSERTGGTVGYGGVRNDTESTLTSGQVSSGQVSSNGVGGVGEGTPQSFMRYPPRKSNYERLPGEAVRLVHDGTHRDADKCGVCHPLPREVVGE